MVSRLQRSCSGNFRCQAFYKGKSMKNSLVKANKFVLPLSMVVAASLGGVLIMGGQSASPVNAAVAPRILPAAEVASFRPFADQAVSAYKPSSVAAPAQNVFVTVNPAPVQAPVTAMPVYGNVDTIERPVVEESAPASVSTPTLVAAGNQGGSGSTCTTGSNTTITASCATITVGSAVINVLSSFKLNYGGKTILTGSNGQTTTP
jgi:hypothetical protein